MSYLQLAGAGQTVQLHTSVTALPGTGGGSIAGWAISGYYPEHAYLLFSNLGAAALTIGDSETGPARLVAGGVPVGDVLFNGLAVTIGPGETVWTKAPLGAAALGTTWAVAAPLASGATVNLSVTARPLLEAPIEVEAAVDLQPVLDAIDAVPTAGENAAASGLGSAVTTIMTAIDALPTAAETATAVDATLTTAHGAGSWAGGAGGPTVEEITEAVLGGMVTLGVGQANTMIDNTAYDVNGVLTGARVRVFLTAEDAAAATPGAAAGDDGEAALLTVTATSAAAGRFTFQRVVAT